MANTRDRGRGGATQVLAGGGDDGGMGAARKHHREPLGDEAAGDGAHVLVPALLGARARS